jgi:UDP-N-acetylglucosamine 2-epimerase
VKIAYLIGTRPEAIRSARLLGLLSRDPAVELTAINTGQHYDWNMLGAFLEELSVPVDVDLGVGPGEPAEQTAAIVARVAGALAADRPHVLCVYGDTNSSMAGALAAARLEVPVAHIEAGCRSFDMTMPEEINRRLIDHVAGLLLAVSAVGRQNLVNEAVPGRIEVVGDPQYDVFAAERERLPPRRGPAGTGLITLHRPNNVDDRARLVSILSELDEVGRASGLRWVFPVHPRTRRTLPGVAFDSIEVTEPLGYRALLAVLGHAAVCVTDSGGLQKEALWMAVPCVTLRSTTEWLETLWQNVNVLAPNGSDIASAVRRTLEPAERDFSNPYGDGRAAERIHELLKGWVRDGAPWAPRPRSAVDGWGRRLASEIT